ncbi:hypothetical protein [Tunicatimonas pelagia]|uniref:hypothetical protein n=1 Tax=Tunicatimonas pelagia TaxID=931531 RepID=UPI0026665A6B|nr:hypothetical protein [Tunicatimonas pelagia]WKN44248.1 hypothetical protein P0M28_04630 [Tunicatimonas pelagia]
MKTLSYFLFTFVASSFLTACYSDEITPNETLTTGKVIWQEGKIVSNLEQQLSADLSPQALPPQLDTLLLETSSSLLARNLPKVQGRAILDYQFQASLPSVSRTSSLQRVSGTAYYSRFLNYTLQYGIFDTGWQTDRVGFQVRTIVRGSYWQKGKVCTSSVEYTVQGKVHTAHVPLNSRMVIIEYSRKGNLSKREQFVFDQIPTEQFSFWRNYADQHKRPVFCLTNRNTYYQKYPRAGRDKLLAQWQGIKPS